MLLSTSKLYNVEKLRLILLLKFKSTFLESLIILLEPRLSIKKSFVLVNGIFLLRQEFLLETLHSLITSLPFTSIHISCHFRGIGSEGLGANVIKRKEADT